MIDVNQAFCRLVRMRREELVGNIFSITYKGHGPKDGIEEYYRRFDRGEIVPRFETHVQLWNSEEVDVEISSSLIEMGRRGRMMLSIFHDITARKRAEEKLREARQELIQISRQAGMAEVATNVLHNVGNVLNSVNTSASLLTEIISNSKARGISRLAQMFEQNRGTLPEFLARENRAEQVTNYVSALSEHIASERLQVLKELTELNRNIEHIKGIVVMQQSYGRAFGVPESQAVPQLIEDALRIQGDALARHHVRIVRQYEPAPEIQVDKHQALRILVNLIANATHAMSEANAENRLLTLRVEPQGTNRIRIAVTDNGVGIAPENLTRIFGHGFTTRKDGHGFGLHSGALSAKEMGGSLSGHSDGPGHGATFTLELPVHAPTEPQSKPNTGAGRDRARVEDS